MPELPEVETIVRGLGPRLTGRRVRAVWWSGKPLHLRRAVDVPGLRAVSKGRVIAAVRRHGKYIVLALRDGRSERADPGIVLHLGMTGRLRVEAASAPRPPHTHVVFSLDSGDELRFVDARRFGWIEPAPSLTKSVTLAALGPDPLGALDTAALDRMLDGVRAPIKAFLLDQRRLAGVGNIYAAEALFRAGVHPATAASRVRRRAGALITALREVLEGSIARRGTTLRDYVDADGRRGDNRLALLVYGRAGEPCVRCGTKIRRRIDGGRATFFCPTCQRR